MIVVVPTIIKSTGAYQLTMETVHADARVREALGDDFDAGFWAGGSVETNNGNSAASLAIPVSGSKGSGYVYSQGTGHGGVWTLSLLYVMVDNVAEPIVLINLNGNGLPNAGSGV